MIEPIQLNLFEEWRPVAENENFLISSAGRCRTLDRIIEVKSGYKRIRQGRMLVPHDNGNGYLAYLINGKHRYIHRLVASAFIPNPENKEEVDHIDGNKANNCLDNLRWVTRSENLMNPATHPRMSEVQLKRTIVMLDADGQFVCEVKGIPVMSKLTGFAESGIKNCLNIKLRAVTCNGFQFVYKDEYNPIKDYRLCLCNNMGYDFVLNNRIVVVLSDKRLYDVFPSTYRAEEHFKVPRKYIYDICNKHITICDKHSKNLPDKCEMYFYKDLVGEFKEEVRQFYRNKYPIPKII